MTDPAALRRRLNVELKRLRARSGLTQRQVANTLDWSPSKIIRIEQGVTGISVTDLKAVLDLYGVREQAAVNDLVEMARGSKRQPFGDYRDVVSPAALRYFSYEATASIIRQVQINTIPGLLQTDEYTRALLTAQDVEPGRIEKLIQSRGERQARMDQADRPELFMILDEAVLQRPVGGRAVMRRQLARLVQASKEAGTSIQVLPFDLGAHGGVGGSFIYLEFATDNDPDLLFAENPLGDYLVNNDPQLTSAYRERFWKLEDQATPARDLEKFIAAHIDV